MILKNEKMKINKNKLRNSEILLNIYFPSLLLMIPAHIPHICNLFNKFDENLCFMVDCFENEIPHFLDIKVFQLGPIIYRKNTHTG